MKSQEKNNWPMTGPEKGIARSAGIVSVGIFTSRILGFIRDMLLAGIFGASFTADAFYVAFRIPNLLRELFAEGSMSAAFVPVFTEYLTNEGKAEAKRLARVALSIILLIVSVVVVFGILFSPQIVSMIAPGFLKDAEKFQLTAQLTRVMFPFLLFISLSALAMGVLNSTGRFGPPAFSSAVYNAVNISMILGLAPYLHMPVFAAALGVTLGGVAQFLIQLPTLHREGFSLLPEKPNWPLHAGVVKMGRLILPTMLGLSVTQVNLLINTFLASFLPLGSVSYLYYGMRLVHFPLGIFAVSLSTALLPTLSAQAAKGDFAALRRSFSFSLRLVFFITFPALFGLILFRVPIVHLLFEHGQFDHIATLGTADAVLFYAVGLWAFAGVRIVVPVFYALQDTKTPVKIAVIAMILNLLLNILLMFPLKHRGLALATSLSAIFNFLCLLWILKHRIHWAEGNRIVRSHLKVVIASSVMVIPAYLLSRQQIWQADGSWEMKAFSLGTAILTSFSAYILFQWILKSEEIGFISQMIKGRLQRNSTVKE
ncbi:MAG: murein biosynthesis integral membrane protein MurJ [Waddliaceae bacterium]